MVLEDIGFYTLEDSRARNVSETSPLWRCELLLTDRCNFSCPYCRGTADYLRGDLSIGEARRTVHDWCCHGLRNLRLSGGEPTLWPGLIDLVGHALDGGVQRVALSTNGSADLDTYKDLIDAGVSDFSISLDACCAATGAWMSGGESSWGKVCANIAALAETTYVTVGVVVTDDNVGELLKTIELAANLGVADIRVISAAQDNKMLRDLYVPSYFLQMFPILKYRLNNLSCGRHIRGLRENDCRTCYLGLDDMASAGGYHFPCIIYLREGGAPIGGISPFLRDQRTEWVEEHDSWENPICQKNCLDVCVDYNNRVRDFREKNA